MADLRSFSKKAIQNLRGSRKQKYLQAHKLEETKWNKNEKVFHKKGNLDQKGEVENIE